MISKVHRFERTQYPKRFRARVNNKKIEGTVKDISESGVALEVPPDSLVDIQNDLFTELQIEGLGSLSGRVARSYEDGFAVAFGDHGEEKKKIIQDEIDKFRKKVGKRRV